MRVTGLSGKSGSGKSYNAIELSAKIKAKGIIDDGLFIYNGTIMAGESAKKQKTKIGAVKHAVFIDDSHCEAVKKAIELTRPEHILVLGTSDGMIIKIAERLGIPKPDRIIQIEEITTEAQRKHAREMRDKEGMHTIPAPTFQVKREFSGFFIDPGRAFKAEGRNGLMSRQKTKNKTVIRPTFSYLGSYEISDRVIDQIVGHIAKTTEGCRQLLWSASTSTEEGTYIRAIIVTVKGVNVISTAESMQRRISTTVAHMTAFNVLGVEVEIRAYRERKNDKS